MEQCPNCGSDVRATARFCTTCGYRIPERPAGSVSADTRSRSDEATSSANAGWPAAPSDDAYKPSAASTESEEPKRDYVSILDSPSNDASSQAEPKRDYVSILDSLPQEQETIEVQEVGGVAMATTEEGETGPVVAKEESINDSAENRINIALFHVERLRHLVPDLSEWSEQQAETVNTAIAELETALKGREDESDPYEALRLNVKSAVKDPRDIDVMIALADRAAEIEDLLRAHDQYSAGLRKALIEIKPAAVNYIAEPPKPTRKRTTRPRKKRTTTTTPAPETS